MILKKEVNAVFLRSIQSCEDRLGN